MVSLLLEADAAVVESEELLPPHAASPMASADTIAIARIARFLWSILSPPFVLFRFPQLPSSRSHRRRCLRSCWWHRLGCLRSLRLSRHWTPSCCSSQGRWHCSSCRCCCRRTLPGRFRGPGCRRRRESNDVCASRGLLYLGMSCSLIPLRRYYAAHERRD